MMITAKSNTSATATIAALVPRPMRRFGMAISCDMVLYAARYPSPPASEPSIKLFRSAFIAKSCDGSLVMIWSSV